MARLNECHHESVDVFAVNVPGKLCTTQNLAQFFERVTRIQQRFFELNNIELRRDQ
jgi:hypothetical protein